VAPDRDADKAAVGLKKQVFGYHENSAVAGVNVIGKDTQEKGLREAGNLSGFAIDYREWFECTLLPTKLSNRRTNK